MPHARMPHYVETIRDVILERARRERRVITNEEAEEIVEAERNPLTINSNRGIIGHNKRMEDNMKEWSWFDMLQILRRQNMLVIHIFKNSTTKPTLRVELESVDELVDWLWMAFTGDAFVDDRTGEFEEVRRFIRSIVEAHDMEDDIMNAEAAEMEGGEGEGRFVDCGTSAEHAPPMFGISSSAYTTIVR